MSTKKYTFQNLFVSTFDSEGNSLIIKNIEIPIIQRDYAQGRENDEVTRIRDRFLTALLDAIIDRKPITLDFIYGDVSANGVLIPLDGQQRLTTLYLLYWYIAKKESCQYNDYKFLENFSYATRFSSRDFCQELIKFTPAFDKEPLSVNIKDQSWYPYEWKNDSTIQGMLVMLDAIHDKFKNLKNSWKSMVNDEIISFYFLALNDMGLTDDLYIKMNSRGKPLTQFEHFKAEFEVMLKQQSEELSISINHKFDNDWTDMLFPFRGDNEIIDDEFMRYFHFISDIICYKSGISLERDEFKVAKLLYGSENEEKEKNIEYFIHSFDCWIMIDIVEFFQKFFSQHNYENNKVNLYQEELNIFKECLDNYGEFSGRSRKFPLSKMLLLYAIITYLQNTEKISEEDFRQRIRIVRNLIRNSDDEIRDERMKTLLAEQDQIILKGIIPVAEKGDLGFNVRQKEEERSKVEWLKTNPDLKEQLFQLEDHFLLKGCIAILGLENFKNFYKFIKLFDTCNKDLINQSLLSLGDYSQLVSWRYQIGSSENESVWISLFHPTKQRKGFENTSKILNVLLTNLEESEITNCKLEQMVKEHINNPKTIIDWKYYLIKYSSMRKGRFGMYYWSDRKKNPYELIMMNTEKTLGGKNWDVFLFTLKKLPEFRGKLSLNDYTSQENKLKLINSDIEIESLNDKYIVTGNNKRIEFLIKQSDGFDLEDRVEKGKQIISDILRQEMNM